MASEDANGLNLAAGKTCRVNGVQILGPRSTGWQADNGTARKAANSTYDGTAEAAYAQGTIQALMDKVRDLSQTQKAIKDALIDHGLIGA